MTTKPYLDDSNVQRGFSKPGESEKVLHGVRNQAVCARAVAQALRSGTLANQGSICRTSPEADYDNMSEANQSHASMNEYDFDCPSDHGYDSDSESAQDATKCLIPPAECLNELAPSMTVNKAAGVVEWIMPIEAFTPLQRRFRGLVSSCPIVVKLDCHTKNSIPSITVPQNVIQNSSVMQNDTRFSNGIALVETAKTLIKKYWPRDTDTLWFEMPKTLNKRLICCGEHCMLCDKPLIVPGVKPTICDSEMCVYQYEQLGLGTDLHMIKHDPSVADLLISVVISAANDRRRKHFAMPILPEGVYFKERPDASTVAQILRMIPPLEKLRSDDVDVTSVLLNAHRGALPLYRWLFATSRAHITLLPEADQCQAMRTKHQFLILAAPHSHKGGSAATKSHFVFHGSDFGNWHNILRTGLMNASKTPMQANGSNYGAGIYFAKWSSTSVSFCKAAVNGWMNSRFGQKPCCIAICQVFEAPTTTFWERSVIVAEDPACVTLRYLFVYETRSDIPDVDTEQDEVREFCWQHSIRSSAYATHSL